MDYFLELYDYIGISSDNAFINNYKKRLEKELIHNKTQEILFSKSLDEVTEYDEYENDKTENYNDYLEIIKNIEKRISSNQSTPNLITYNSNSNQYLNLKTVDLELVISNSNEHVKKTVPAKNKYLHFKDYGALEEAFEIKNQLSAFWTFCAGASPLAFRSSTNLRRHW